MVTNISEQSEEFIVPELRKQAAAIADGGGKYQIVSKVYDHTILNRERTHVKKLILIVKILDVKKAPV